MAEISDTERLHFPGYMQSLTISENQLFKSYNWRKHYIVQSRLHYEGNPDDLSENILSEIFKLEIRFSTHKKKSQMKKRHTHNLSA